MNFHRQPVGELMLSNPVWADMYGPNVTILLLIYIRHKAEKHNVSRSNVGNHFSHVDSVNHTTFKCDDLPLSL